MEANIKAYTEKFRHMLALFVLSSCLGAVIIAFWYGYGRNEVGSDLKDTWAVVGPIAGAITGYYFGERRK